MAPVASTSRAAALSDSEMVEEMVVQRSSRARTTALGKGKKVQSESESEESDEDGGEGLTRCVCAEDSESDSFLRRSARLMVLRFPADELGQALMIQCDTCKCWQHGPCVGLWGEKVSPAFLPLKKTRFRPLLFSRAICISARSLAPLSRRTVPIATFASYAVQAGTAQAGPSPSSFPLRNHR